mmetsp:Transcript_45217/g.96197  ORF Transcript_45217/g.96197 Transcript_45217/m.96197 type:complete len:163 (-) Transcript_45217:574-1062(-)
MARFASRYSSSTTSPSGSVGMAEILFFGGISFAKRGDLKGPLVLFQCQGRKAAHLGGRRRRSLRLAPWTLIPPVPTGASPPALMTLSGPPIPSAQAVEFWAMATAISFATPSRACIVHEKDWADRHPPLQLGLVPLLLHRRELQVNETPPRQKTLLLYFYID